MIRFHALHGLRRSQPLNGDRFNFAPLPSLARAPRLIEVTRYTMDTEEPPADEEDHAMEQAEASEPADSSSAPGTDEDRKHQAEQHERLFGSASTAEDAPAAADEPDDPDDPDEAPVVLNDAQKERLIAAIDEMRRSTRNVNTRCLGPCRAYRALLAHGGQVVSGSVGGEHIF